MTRRHVRTIRPFGAHVVVTSDDARIDIACGAAVDRFPRDAGVSGRFRLDVVTALDAPGDPAWPATTLEHGSGGITLRCGSAVLEVDHRARSAALRVPAVLWETPDAIRMYVEGAVSSMLIGNGKLHAVHSGLVVLGGRGVVLRGPSGAGKSTMTYACLQNGFAMASDDWIYGIAETNPDRLFGYPWRMFLVPDTTRYFPELAGVQPIPHPGADRYKLPIQPPVSLRRRSAPADIIVFLDPSPNLDIRRVGTDEARELFWRPALPTERADLPAEWVDRLLDRPCYVLQRGTSPIEAAELLKTAINVR